QSLARTPVPPTAPPAPGVLAPSLPGFGASAKPLGVPYGFAFFERAIDGFLDAVGIGAAPLGLVVHDLGGPIGLDWALERPARVERLALLNTLVYPELDEAVLAFIRGLLEPAERERLTSPEG